MLILIFFFSVPCPLMCIHNSGNSKGTVEQANEQRSLPLGELNLS